MSRLISRVLGDVVLTHDEVEGLMANLLVALTPPTGETDVSQKSPYSTGSRK
ncbi:MAG: hypothetical protein ACYC5Y_12645 [Symbiobacteriia bacterium]